MKIQPFKELLVLVVGTTPQIVTETIYALAHLHPPIRPEKLHIVTTAIGRNAVRKELIESGLFAEFTREFDLADLSLGEDDIIVPKQSSNGEIADIVSEGESEAMGDCITTLIRSLAEDSRTRLHCSIAGGRKTMSFYVGAALQLFGRPWDKLYHVLVSRQFESNPHFFYKPKKHRIIEARLPDGSVIKLDTKDAEIHLAELPFIRLREKISLQGKGFKDLVREGQTKIDTAMFQPELQVDLATRTVRIGDRIVEMIPVQLMVYTALLRQKTDGCKYPDRVYCGTCAECFEPMSALLSRDSVDRMIEDYRRMYHHTPDRADELKNKWHGRSGTEAFRQTLSKISRSIREQLPDERLHPHYTVATERIYGGSRYGVRVEKGKVKIE